MKPVRFFSLAVITGLAIFLLNLPAYSQQGFLGSFDPAEMAESKGQSYLDITTGFRKYFSSFTSYQFPSSDGSLDPLSRLEFPWDQTFVAIKARAAYTGLEVNVEWSGTLTLMSGAKAQDSDWEDPHNPGQKTTFSECNANPRCWILDISANAGIPGLNYFRGVVGYRTSQFKFTDSDGYQYSIYNQETQQYEYSSLPLPGATIEFSQFYQHLYCGGIVDGLSNLGGIIGVLRLPPLLTRIQADVSYVTGSSNDQHLLRYANGLIKSRGVGWHVNLVTGFRTGRFGLYVDADIRGIRATGNIDKDYDSKGIRYAESVEGSKVWSEEKYVGVYGTIFF